jgi:hypothetical protein
VADHVEDQRDDRREQRHRAVGVGLLTLAPAQVRERRGGDAAELDDGDRGGDQEDLEEGREPFLGPGMWVTPAQTWPTSAAVAAVA